MGNLLNIVENKNQEEQKHIAIYKAVKEEGYGLSDDGCVYVGLKLELQPESEGHDVLQEQIENIGSEGNIEMPDGIEEGKMYIAKPCNVSRDWESGIIDDWDVELREYTPSS